MLENLQRTSTANIGLQPNSQVSVSKVPTFLHKLPKPLRLQKRSWQKLSLRETICICTIFRNICRKVYAIGLDGTHSTSF